MAGFQFKSLSGSELIEIPDDQFELSLETPDGRRDIKLDKLMAFLTDALAGRVLSIEETLETLGLDPDEPRTITVDGDVTGSASLMANNVTLTLTVPDGALTPAKVAGLTNTLLGLRLDVNDALDGLETKLDATAPAVSAHKLETARTINGVLFDGTEDIEVTLSPEQVEQLGTDKHHHHIQSAPSALWAVEHNLGKRPSVHTVDSAGTVVEGAITWLDANNLIVEFAGAMAGEAYIN